jgi:hypothetical protein
MKRSLPYIVAGACSLLLAASPDASPDPSSPQAAYRAALAQMHGVAEPAYIAYRTDIPAGKSTLVVRRGTNGRAELALETGGDAPANHWQVAYRTSDRLASIPLADRTHVLSSLALFDPTWNGVNVWMRRGLTATAQTPQATPTAGTEPSPSPPAVPVIAVVSAMSASDYTIEDAGPGDCEGRPGRALRLIAKHDAQNHPLQGVTIDVATQRFCTMRFALRAGNLAGSITGTVELHFGDVAGYYLVTGGIIQANVRSIGISIGRVSTSFTYTDMTFPALLPESDF